MLKCRDIVRMASDGSAQDASFGKRVAIRIHLMMCVHCRRFFRQMSLLGRLVRERADEEINQHPPPDGMEERLVRKLCSITSNGDEGRGEQ